MKKTMKALVVLMIVVSILFASMISVAAIDFDAEEVYKSVFVIFSGKSMGSGFALQPDCIVTNAHVITDADNVEIEDYYGNSYPAEVYSINREADIAVLIVKNTEFTYLVPSDLAGSKIGDDVYAIGAPNGMAYTLTKGTLSAKERVLDYASFIQIDAAINSGNSGGPLLDNNGMVLGMNTMKFSDSEGIGFAIPIDRILEYLMDCGLCGSETSSANTQDTESDIVDTEESESQGTVNTPGTGVQSEKAKNKLSVSVWLGITIFSLALNVILIILLCRSKMSQNRKNEVVIEASERTDFDIDILD